MSEEVPTYRIGMDGFIWFIGVVESVTDPLCVGRSKVRIIGHHDADTDKLSTDDLPWAYALAPTTQSQSIANYRCGDWVVGFFLDGKLCQAPIILGVLPAIPQPDNSGTVQV